MGAEGDWKGQVAGGLLPAAAVVRASLNVSHAMVGASQNVSHAMVGASQNISNGMISSAQHLGAAFKQGMADHLSHESAGRAFLAEGFKELGQGLGQKKGSFFTLLSIGGRQ